MLREPKEPQSAKQGPPPGEISSNQFKQTFAENPDILFSEVAINNTAPMLTVAFIDGMVSSQLIDDYIIKPLIQESALGAKQSANELITLMLQGAVYHCQRKLCQTREECTGELLSGSAVVFFDDVGQAVAFDVKGFDKRGVSEPSSENVLKGSKESFIEVLRVNTALVRRRLQTDSLKINQQKAGKRSGTAISIVYLDGVANPDIVTAVKDRLAAIDIDGIISAGQVETYLLERRNSPIPQIIYTERVDKFCANVLEGRVGILIDGLPMGYITPVDLMAFIQAPEDYANGHIMSSAVRLMRFVCAFAALMLPALYVSVTTFHQEMIPTKLAVSIISNKQGVPFPSYLEVLLMLLAFEILLEAGLRLPQAVGSAVSIVGGLVVGQAAISAGILSPGVVIVIAATGISGFVIPSQDFSNMIRLFRAGLVLLAIAGGLFTVTLGLIVIIYRMCSLEIFGVPYLSPFVASEGRGMFSDTIVRTPWHKAKTRPRNISPRDERRQGGE